jgi:hypothetical protein
VDERIAWEAEIAAMEAAAEEEEKSDVQIG